MTKSKPVKVLIASMLMGGGHNALRDYLHEELTKDTRFEVNTYTNTDKSFDKFNDLLSLKMRLVYDFVNTTITGELASLVNLGIFKECHDKLKLENPAIVIATNPLIAYQFAIAKKVLNRNTLIISSIIDFGKPFSSWYWAKNKILRPDGLLVFDKTTKQDCIQSSQVPAERVLLTGYLPRKIFLKGANDIIKTDTNKAEVKALLLSKAPIYRNISLTKPTVLLTSGSGGFADKSYTLLKKIAEIQKKDPFLQERVQFLVICGNNTKYYNKLHKKNSKIAGWSNIFPTAWLSTEEYASIQRFAAFPIMFSVAPSTFLELIFSNCGPLIIHSLRAAHESGNAMFIVQNRLGLFVKEKRQLLKMIYEGLDTKLIEQYKTARAKLINNQLEKAKNIGDLLFDFNNKFSINTTDTNLSDKTLAALIDKLQRI